MVCCFIMSVCLSCWSGGVLVVLRWLWCVVLVIFWLGCNGLVVVSWYSIGNF